MFREEFTLLPFLQLSPTNSDLNISQLLGAVMKHMDFRPSTLLIASWYFRKYELRSKGIDFYLGSLYW